MPNRDRLSVLIAMVLLTFALGRLLDVPSLPLETEIFGSTLSINLSSALLMRLLAAGLISAGADTLIRSHPRRADASSSTVLHWIVPGAAALVLGAALERLPDGAQWWLGLGLSALALLAVLAAEYATVDPDDPARDLAGLSLAWLAYILALLLFALLHALGLRAVLAAPTTGLMAAGLAWRLLVLRAAPPLRAGLYSGVAGLICAQCAWALAYWRLDPASAGALLLLPFHVAVGAAQQHLAGRLTRRVWIEFILIGLAGLGLALWAGLR